MPKHPLCSRVFLRKGQQFRRVSRMEQRENPMLPPPAWSIGENRRKSELGQRRTAVREKSGRKCRHQSANPNHPNNRERRRKEREIYIPQYPYWRGEDANAKRRKKDGGCARRRRAPATTDFERPVRHSRAGPSEPCGRRGEFGGGDTGSLYAYSRIGSPITPPHAA